MGETKPDLEPRSRYCKWCEDKYWNHSDCDSIRKNGACVYCIREGRNKDIKTYKNK